MSIVLAIFGLLENNIIFIISSLIALGYNIYSRIKKVHIFNVSIDDRKNNLIDANRVSFLYKIKFVLYTLLTMFAVAFLVLNYYGPLKIIMLLRLI